MGGVLLTLGAVMSPQLYSTTASYWPKSPSNTRPSLLHWISKPAFLPRLVRIFSEWLGASPWRAMTECS